MAYPPLPQATSRLDGPPPSPQAVGGGPTGAPTPFSLQAMAPPVPSNQIAPEMLTGVLQSSEKIGQLLDGYAQALPDLAAEFASVKDHLQQVLAKVLIAGAQPTSPTATGSQFPGGGFDRGIASAGAV